MVGDKATRVFNFHKQTVLSLAEMIAAAGLSSPRDLKPHHILRRAGGGKIQSLANQVIMIGDGDLLAGKVPEAWRRPWATAKAERF